jgi:hypothetical protein
MIIKKISKLIGSRTVSLPLNYSNTSKYNPAKK